MEGLSGKVAIITGAAGGQGMVEAELFARRGIKVVVTDIDTKRGEEVARRIGGEGAECFFAELDVADEAAWVRVCERTAAKFGRIDILVNNAGTMSRKRLADLTLDSWARTVGVNLTGPMLGMKHCAPTMRDGGGGAIVNVSSTAAFTAHSDIAYTATKWGLRGLTRTAALQLAAWGIRVNSVHPGQISETSFFAQSDPARLAALKHAIPMRRSGSPSECAQVVLFLVSDAASYMTGAELTVDGGYVAAGLASLRESYAAEIAQRGAPSEVDQVSR